MKNKERHQDLDLLGCRQVVAAIIENAIEDYRNYAALGCVIGMELNQQAWEQVPNKKGTGLMWRFKGGDLTSRNQQVNRHTVQKLLTFMKQHMDGWLELADMNLDGARLRATLAENGANKPNNPSPYRHFSVEESTEAVAA
jgi:hypothetical protein